MNQAKLIAKFTKNALEEIRINLSHYRGKELIDIRIWVLSDKGEFVPTKKGVAIPREKYPELKKAFDNLDKILPSKYAR